MRERWPRRRRDAAAVFHSAAQVAVTTSMAEPIADFEVNVPRHAAAAGGAARGGATRRRWCSPAPTRSMATSPTSALALARRALAAAAIPSCATRGVGRAAGRLEFHTPYGCSKGAADQYVLDYARSFGVPTAVLRMSCIYGPRQQGHRGPGLGGAFPAIARLAGAADHDLRRRAAGARRAVRGRCGGRLSRRLAAHRRAWPAALSTSAAGPANAVSLRDLLARTGAR